MRTLKFVSHLEQVFCRIRSEYRRSSPYPSKHRCGYINSPQIRISSGKPLTTPTSWQTVFPPIRKMRVTHPRISSGKPSPARTLRSPGGDREQFMFKVFQTCSDIRLRQEPVSARAQKFVFASVQLSRTVAELHLRRCCRCGPAGRENHQYNLFVVLAQSVPASQLELIIDR